MLKLKVRTLQLSLALFALTLCAVTNAQVLGQFTDRTGSIHPWSINSAHTLIWDNAPFIPVGGVFIPKYLANGATDANWKSDTQSLDLLKQKGLTDIIIDPYVSATDVTSAAWQKLIDYLDSNGFRYGIAFGMGIDRPLTGTLIKPSIYRTDNVNSYGEASWRVAASDKAHYYLVDTQDGSQIFREGEISVNGGVATAPAGDKIVGTAVGLLYPHVVITPYMNYNLPDIWGGFDAYRDHLLAIFSNVKFGSGLRFFIDPLGDRLGIPPNADYLIPDSQEFEIEWEAWLRRRYSTVDALVNAWGVVDHDLNSYETAARLIPLWSNGRGIPMLNDPKTGTKYTVKWNVSKYWANLHECRDSAIIYYMNAAADILKQQVADVPVIYTRTDLNPIFANANKIGGFDGYGVPAYGKGQTLVSNGADSAVVQCNEALRPMWCIVSETAPSDANASYASRDSMFQDLNLLDDIGCKGFFVKGYDGITNGYNMLSNLGQLDWLAAYKQRIQSDMTIATAKPNILLYPISASGLVQEGNVPGYPDAWWCPTLAPGKPLMYGSSFAGYNLLQPSGQITVLWSLTGQRETNFLLDDPKAVSITTPEGLPVKGKIDMKKRTLTVMMDDNPLIFHTMGQDIFPLEAAQDALKQLKYLIDLGVSEGIPVEQFRYYLERADSNYHLNNQETSFLMSAEAINNLVNIVEPFIWQEAEDPSYYTFSDKAPLAGASGGYALSLDTASPPGSDGYMAQYKIHVTKPDQFTVWVSGTPPGNDASPFIWNFDSDQPHNSSDAKVVGAPWFMNQLVWMKLGTVMLNPGDHTFTIRATEPAAGTGRYFLTLDSILLTRTPFTPSGIMKPPLNMGAVKVQRNGKK